MNEKKNERAPYENLEQQGNKENITILVGSGNNGGDGMVAARHLFNWDKKINVILTSSIKKFSPLAMQQYKAMKAMDVPFISLQKDNHKEVKKYIESSDLIIDALLGVGLKDAPRGSIYCYQRSKL